MKTTAFAMTADNAMLFFQLCSELKLETEAEKVTLLLAMGKQGKLINVWSTDRTKEKLIQDLSKHFGKVLRVK